MGRDQEPSIFDPYVQREGENIKVSIDEAERNNHRRSRGESFNESTDSVLVGENEVYVRVPSKSIDLSAEAYGKLYNLIQVVHSSLLTQYVATPLVFLSPSSWRLQSHSEFRARKRKQLEAIMDSITTNKGADISKLMDELDSVLVDIFRVKLPAMPEFYENDESFSRVSCEQVCTELCLKLHAARSLDFQSRARVQAAVVLQWFTYCPVGRPYVFLSDDLWVLVSEKEQRKFYRQQIVIE